MIKNFTQKYAGMSQDVTLSKTQDKKYWSANNLRIVATTQSSTFSITNEMGNEKVFDIPTPGLSTILTSVAYTVNGTPKYLPYKTRTSDIVPPRCQIEDEFMGKTSGVQKIIGVTEARDSVVIVTTDNAGWDCIWELTDLNSGSFGLDLLYMNNLGLSTSHPVQILYNYENSIIEKIYLVDGVNQLRYMNLRQSTVNGDLLNLADMEPTAIDTVSNFELSQPVITNVVGGGSHTSGMIQYAYGLYVLNGSQTTISPVSELRAIDKGPGLGGGEVNENLGKSVIVSIPNIDPDYTHIKIYAIKYTSYQQDPEVTIVVDKEIDNYTSMTYFDNGRHLYPIDLATFIFLGSAPKIPRHIATKKSRMFLFNVKEKNFNVDADMRAYGHNSGGSAVIWENLTYSGTTVNGQSINVNTTTYSVPKKHDAINKDYDIYKFQKDGVTYGGSGKFLDYELYRSNVANSENYKFFKDNEIYRISIRFFNGRGQYTDPIWVADFITPIGNLLGQFNQLKVTLKSEFQTWVDAQTWDDDNAKPIGFEVLRADRELSDRSIMAQGMLNSTVASYPTTTKYKELAERKSKAESSEARKMPSLTRTFATAFPVHQHTNYWDLSFTRESPDANWDRTLKYKAETYKAENSKDWRVQTFQFGKLMQMYSPDISFSDVSVDSSQQLYILGLAKENEKAMWAAESTPGTGVSELEAKFEGGLNRDAPIANKIKGDLDNLNDKGLFAATDSKQFVSYNQMYRSFKGLFIPVISGRDHYEISGTPEITERGADWTSYNGDGRLRYANHLLEFLQDDFQSSQEVNSDSEQTVVGCNALGERCITLMEGAGDLDQALSIEQIHSQSITLPAFNNNGVLIAELRAPKYTYYVGGYYGGFTYEAKSLSNYLPIGAYTSIDTGTVHIVSPGDTFVGDYKFTKLSKTESTPDRSQTQLTEIIEFTVETTVDLKNRADLSLEVWDNRWQPSYDEYHKYNAVYSQQPKLLSSTAPGFKYKQVNEFDTRIIASKEKIAGENIDSWTDFLENEQKDLDGKYGPINDVINFNDEIFTLQDTAVAKISINPRVQTQGSDGISIELGVGAAIHDYHYITTESGALTKWGTVATPSGFYYFDLLNKSINKISQGAVNITDQQGMHTYFEKNINYDSLIKGLPGEGDGVSTGYNPVNQDVYFSFLQGTNSFTIAFNEVSQSFTSFYDYIPAFYINKGNKMITTGPLNTTLWEHFRGNRGQYYGQYYDTDLKFNVNSLSPDSVSFNNIKYRTQVTDAQGIIMPVRTLNTIRVHNDYQDTGIRQLTLNSNLKKRLQTFTAQIPRELGTMHRIRSPWAFMEFTFSNGNDEKLILHDITVFYTQH